MSAGMQRRLARAGRACGIETWWTRPCGRLSAATGELTTTRPADAPLALAGVLGDRLGGLGACLVLATFRWWLGLLFLALLAVRPPLRQLVAERATLIRRATPALGQAGTTWAARTGRSSPRRCACSA